MRKRRRDRYSPEEWIDFALNLCRGIYQRAIVTGAQRISGSDLRGKARSYGGFYRQSRETILARMRAAGIPHEVKTFKGSGVKIRLVIAGRVL